MSFPAAAPSEKTIRVRNVKESSVGRSRTPGVAFGIIIVSFNTRDLTLACLRSLAQHAAEASIIVVDNASGDGSAEAIAAEFPTVLLVPLDYNIGFGRANTLAMDYLAEDTIVLLNSDTVVTDDALQRCVTYLVQRPSLAAVTPRLVGVDGTEQNTRHAVPAFRQTLQRALWGRPLSSPAEDFWIPGTCMVLSRPAVKAAGGLFSSQFFIYWEDADLCSRLNAAGYNVDVVQDAEIVHHGGASGGGPNCTAKPGLHEWYTFGRHVWFRRHRPKWEAACLWLLEFIDAFRCMGRAVLRSSRRHEFQYGRTLLKTLVRQVCGLTPVFAVPNLHGRWDVDLVPDDVRDTIGRSPKSTIVSDTAQATGVVVIGRNEGERLKRSLVSIQATKCPFVYVDSGSTDGSQQLARSFGATVVELDLSTPFTAARARMEGLLLLLKMHPALNTVQFVDGDCELNAAWLAVAEAVLAKDPECAIVCGVLRERKPERSIYNQLCQLEWRRPPGKIASCGGIFLARVEAMTQSGGFDTSLIAGEEPELCLRLRAQKWNIQAIAQPMARHDAAITKFSQWWKRSVRAGFGYAQGHAMHGHRAEKFRRREVCSILFYGLVAPLFGLAAAWHTCGMSLLMLVLGYGRLYVRIRDGRSRQGDVLSDAAVYAKFVVLGKFAQAIGVIRFYANRLFRRVNRLIEYK